MIFYDPLQQSGDRSKRILSLLSSIASNELLTHKLYSELLQSPYASKKPKLVSSFQTASAEDLDHFNAISECIARLNGQPVGAELAETNHKGNKYSRLNFKKIIKTLSEIESFSVKAYVEICKITLEYDYRIFDLSYRNMHENMHHLSNIKAILAAQNLSEIGLQNEGSHS